MVQVDITCEPGTPLGGNARVDKTARGVHDRLHATVLALVTDGGVDVMVGTDLLAVPRRLVLAVQNGAANEVGIDPGRVIVHATHTHSGPDTTHGMGFDRHDYSAVELWEADAVARIVAAIAAAVRDAVPARARLGRTQIEGVAFNRRIPQRGGGVRMNWEEGAGAEFAGGDVSGVVDRELTIMAFDSGEGEPIGAIVHFALHPAILAGHDWLVSADYVEVVNQTVSAELGGRPILYASGALGDVNHLDFRRPGRAIGFQESRRVGTVVAQGALAALRTAIPVAGHVESAVLTRTLEQRTVSEAEILAAREALRANDSQAVDALDGIPSVAYAVWAVERGAALTPALDVTVNVLRIGPLVLVAFPFEVFVEFGIELREAFGEWSVKVVSLAGDYLGYLPTERAFDEGGYEPTLGTSTVRRGQGEQLFSHMIAWLRTWLNRSTIEMEAHR